MRGAITGRIVETQYFSFIDALRGMATAMVLGVHVGGVVGGFQSRLFVQVMENGARGVQLFFIVSAFTLMASAHQRAGRELRPVRNFYIRRAFRILPLWWMALIVYALHPAKEVASTTLGSRVPLIVDIGLHATFLYGFLPATIASIIPVGWSLFVEETFYVALPWLQRRVSSIREASCLTAGLLALSMAWYLLVKIGWPGHEPFAFMFPAAQWFCFGLGFVVFFAVQKLNQRPLSTRWARALDAAAALSLAASVAGTWLPGPRHYGAALAFGLLCLAMSQTSSLWRWMLDRSAVRMLGKYCYSIYLFHLFVLTALAPLWGVLGQAPVKPEVRFLAAFAVALSGCLFLGAISFNLFERPLVSLGRRVVQRLEAKFRARSIPIGGNVVKGNAPRTVS